MRKMSRVHFFNHLWIAHLRDGCLKVQLHYLYILQWGILIFDIGTYIWVTDKKESEGTYSHYMCDFHDFGLTWKCQKMCFWVVAWLPQRLKSMFFEIFSHSAGPFGAAPFEKISHNVDFSLWGKQCNETKIVKITHSEGLRPQIVIWTTALPDFAR